MERRRVFLVMLFGLTSFGGVFADQARDIKIGVHPYMAFIYYSDPAVVDAAGERFIRSAIIIRENWLVTAAMGETFINAINGFPRKTLLARAGVVSIDSNFTLNEEEDEQEREIVQIVRPSNHSATRWWTTDISLVKTLFPFKVNSAVAARALSNKRDVLGKTCSVLVFAKKHGNTTADEKVLTLLKVKILPPSMQNCGSHFSETTMVCASDENNETVPEHFCHGNSGGPLICDQEVVGLQTYIDNDCKQPHLYQLLSAWDTFISCGVEDKCNEEQCGNICDVTYKDPDTSTSTEIADGRRASLLNITQASTAMKIKENPEATTQMKNFLIEDLPGDTTISSMTTTLKATDGIPTTTTKLGEETTLYPSYRHEPETVLRLIKEKTKKPAHAKASYRRAKVSKKKVTHNSSTRNLFIVDTLFFGCLVFVCL